ncbi:hypothetical protein [Streptomyces sp. NPDC096351]|uniref:hypothetical protein n=1 Tax=Streptomyces sp. NPDC096351 TaxID=3366087 RepID=UPI00380E5DDD
MTDQTASLRHLVAAAIHHYDAEHALAGNDMPSKHHYGEADSVLAALDTEARIRDAACQATPVEIAAADRLVAEARRDVHESLTFLAAPEADRVRALIADLETAVEGRTAIRDAARQASGQQPDTGATCTECNGTGADPEDEGDYDDTVHMHNPTTVGPCPECHGTGKVPTVALVARSASGVDTQPAVDRASVLREAADIAERENAGCPTTAMARPCPPCVARTAAATTLRRMADEETNR